MTEKRRTIRKPLEPNARDLDWYQVTFVPLGDTWHREVTVYVQSWCKEAASDKARGVLGKRDEWKIKNIVHTPKGKK